MNDIFNIFNHNSINFFAGFYQRRHIMKLKKLLSLVMALCLVLTLMPLNMKFAYAALNPLDAALNASGGSLTFVNDTGHPWLVDSTTDAGRTSAVSNISHINNGTTTITLNAGTIAKNKVLMFDWNVNSESGHDLLYFIVNGTPNTYISGQTGTWATYKYVIPSTGTYTFTWVYQKDNAVDAGADCGWIDNVAITDFVSVQNVIVTPVTSPVNIGFTTQLTATIVPSNATVQDVTWSSDDTSLATVDSSGVVTGVAQGLVHIMATSVDGAIVGEANVNVQAPIATTGVSLNYIHGTLLIGDTGSLIATIAPALASYRTISWYTSNAAIATVTTAGVVTGVAAGVVDITAQTQTGNFTATCRITVIASTSLKDQTYLTYTPVTVGSTTPVTLDWQNSSYIIYNRSPLMPTTTARGFSVYLQAGKKISFGTGGTSLVDTYLDLYNSSWNRLAYDDDGGDASYSLIYSYVVPVTGTYYILVSGYDTTAKGSFNLYVSEVPPIPVTGVTFNQDTFSVPLNYTLPLPYSILPGNADIQGVTFTSSNTSAITVNAAGGVTGVAPGSSVITIKTVQGGYTDTCLVSVGYTAVQSVNFDTDAVIVGLNQTKTLLYTILPAEAQLRGVTFTSNNLSVATVDTAGVVTAKGLGNAVITATTADGGKTDTCSVQVVAVNVSTCASLTFAAGDVWGDGTGYQMLLDANADAYGRLFQKTAGLNISGDVPDSVYNQFEIKIPSNADGALTTKNIILNSSVTILIPAGIYDYCITNPVPGDKVWIANTTFNSPGRYDNFNFQAGYSYTFVMTSNNSPIPAFKRDVTTLTATYTGAGLSKYDVNYSVSGTGGTLSGKTDLHVEEGYTLTAADIPTPVPNTGYHFVGWNVNPLGTAVNAAISFTATFAINTYVVIFKDWNNTVLKTQENVPYGSAATAPTAPNTKTYYHFIGWSPDFSAVTSNITVIAQYAIDAYAINLPTSNAYIAAPEGTSVNPTPRGGNFTFTVTLNPNYSNSTIVVTANGTTLTPVRSVYTIANVTEIKTVTVTGAVLNNAVYTALDAAIALVPAYSDANYTTATITAFRNAVTAGQGVSRTLNVLSQSVVDAAAAAIVSAYNSLVLKPAVYTALDTALALTPAYNDVYYTQVTITAFRSAITAGQSVSRSLNITQQTTVDNATAAINTAFANLVLRPAQTQFVINSTSSLVINRTNNTVTGFSVRSNSVANILAQFNNSAIITVTSVKGVLLTGSNLVGTGSVIKLLSKDGTVVDQVTAIVYGDTDGNGIADGLDATTVSLIAAGMLTQAQAGSIVYAAADANHDGLINSTDVTLLNQSGLFLVNVS